MSLRINTNIAAMDAYRNLSVSDMKMRNSLEKLSSGYRINRAADDAAGLATSEGLKSQIGGLTVASRNAQDGVNVVQTADGALGEVTSILQRMRDLSVQASNTGSEDSTAINASQAEFTQLNSEIDRIASTTSFGQQHLLDGSYGTSFASTGSAQTDAGFSKTIASGGGTFTLTGLTTSAGASLGSVTVNLNAGTYSSPASLAAEVNRGLSAALKAAGGAGNEVTLSALDSGSATTFKLIGAQHFTTADGTATPLATDLGLTPGLSTAAGTGGVFQVGANAGETISVAIGAVTSQGLGTNTLNLTTGASAAITAVDNAITTISSTRANLGAIQNRFTHTINNLSTAIENVSASESSIADVDMASEMTNYTKLQVLQQAGTAMLAQANQSAQGVLKLLQ